MEVLTELCEKMIDSKTLEGWQIKIDSLFTSV